jgi:hypothetical protein
MSDLLRGKLDVTLDDEAAAFMDEGDLVLPSLDESPDAYIAAPDAHGRWGIWFRPPFQDVGFWSGDTLSLVRAFRLRAAIQYFRRKGNLRLVKA